MNVNVFKRAFSYVNLIIINYQIIAKMNAAVPILRLIAKECDKKTGEICFKIQVAGKNIFPVLSLRDFKNPATIANFSKKDQNTIRSYFSDERKKICNRIIARTYDIETKKFKYTIEFFDSELKIKKFKIVDNISLLSNDIRNFDMEDALLIQLESNKN